MAIKAKLNLLQYTVNQCTLKPHYIKPAPLPPPPRTKQPKTKKKKDDDDCEKKCMSCNFKCNWDGNAIARLQRLLKSVEKDLKDTRVLLLLDEKKGELIADIDEDPKKNPKFPYAGDGVEGIREQIHALSNQLNTIGQNIGISEVIVSHPIDWELKAEHHREQLAVIYLEDLGNGKYGKTPYTVHIPHFDKSKFDSLQKSSFPVYQKGNIIGILTLSDNSKIIVNCVDRKNAEDVINVMKTFVKSNYLQGSWLKMTDRKDDIKTFKAVPYMVEYYVEGSKSETTNRKYLK